MRTIKPITCFFCRQIYPDSLAKCPYCDKEQPVEDNTLSKFHEELNNWFIIGQRIFNKYTPIAKQIEIPKRKYKKKKHDSAWTEEKDAILLKGMALGLGVSQIQRNVNTDFNTAYTIDAVKNRVSTYENEKFGNYLPETQEEMKRRKIKYYLVITNGNNNNPAQV